MQTKYIKYSSKAIVCTTLCILLMGAFLNSCKKDNEGGNGVTILNSFGPTPIARGAELRFIGENLDKVTSILLPDSLEIPASAFTTKTSTLIAITVPQDAMPGVVKLRAPQGNIITKTRLAFSEPISITSFSPALAKADSIITITGDYLNLVKQVIFTSNIAVGDTAFITHTRTQIQVKIPAAAQTGKISVSNGADNPIIVYSTSDLTLKLPMITSVSPNPVKAGTALTITGTDLDLIKTVVFGGNKQVTSFTNQSLTQLVVTVPADAQDDTLKIIPASGITIKGASKLVLVVPTISVAPTTVKNGADITVTGTNLDLVDHVAFGGNVNGTIKAGGTSIQILVTVPNTAVTGTVNFVTKANKTVNGPSLTIVDPVFSSFSPTSAKAGQTVTITGTDLDLVTSVAFTGGLTATIGSGRTSTQLDVTVPVGAKTGNITLVTLNGDQISSPSSFTVLAHLPTITSFTESRGTPGQILTINGTSLSLIKQLVFPGNIVATDYGIKSDTKVEVYVPTTVTWGVGTIAEVTYEGEEGLLPGIFFGSLDAIKTDAHIIVNYDDKNNMWGGGGFHNGQTTSPNGISGNYARWTISGATDGWNDPSNCGTWAGDANGLSGVPADFVLKIDFFANKPFAKTAAIEFTIGGKVSKIYPPCDLDQTSGWITITVPMTQFGVTTMSGLGDISMNVRAPSSTPVDLEYCMDNIRIESK